MSKKLTWRDVEKACQVYNKTKGLTEWNSFGRLSFGDVGGFGGKFIPRLWRVINSNGGLSRCYALQGKTHRETIANIQLAMCE